MRYDLFSPLMTPPVPLTRLQEEMNRLFEDFFQEVPTLRSYATTFPAVNLWEDAERGYVEAELPGLTLGEIDVTVMGNQLTLSGERKIAEPKDCEWLRRERPSGKFTRVLTLPWDIDADKVEAKLQDGVLGIKLMKSESAKARKVKVVSA